MHPLDKYMLLAGRLEIAKKTECISEIDLIIEEQMDIWAELSSQDQAELRSRIMK